MRSEDNWKLFSANLGPSYPSRRTHPSGYIMTKKWNNHKIAIWGAFLPKSEFFLPTPTIPAHTYPPLDQPANRLPAAHAFLPAGARHGPWEVHQMRFCVRPDRRSSSASYGPQRRLCLRIYLKHDMLLLSMAFIEYCRSTMHLLLSPRTICLLPNCRCLYMIAPCCLFL
jgi:hypothetical protein